MAQWSVILSVSANSMEVAALGALDGATEPQQWFQWMQGRNSIALLKSQQNFQQTFQQSFQYYRVSHTTIETLLKSLLRFQQSY